MDPRVVVATNVLVGALLSKGGGENREIIRLCLAGQVRPLVGVALLAEFIVTNNIKDVRRGELQFPHISILTPKQFTQAY